METRQQNQSCSIINYDGEKWSEIPGYDGKYFISSIGRVRNKKIIRRPVKRKDGYIHLKLRKDGRDKMMMVHRLVAATFLRNLTDELEVNHKNGDRSNNSLENLEIVTRSQNMKHRSRFLGYTVAGSKNPRAIFNEEEVASMRKEYKSSSISVADMARKYKVKDSCMRSLINGKTWKHVE